MTSPKPPDLSDEELVRVRALLAQDAFVRQFWASVRTWVIAVAAIVAGITVGFVLGVKSQLPREREGEEYRR
jgi:hypothetical protein